MKKLRKENARRLQQVQSGAKAKAISAAKPLVRKRRTAAKSGFNSAKEPLTPESLLMYGGRAFTRLPVLLALVPFCAPQEWFRLLGKKWSDCDNIGRYRLELWLIFHLAKRADIERMMDADERKAHAALPETFTAWRGCYDFNQEGFSYSLDRDLAAEFPTLHRYHVPERQPLLLTAKIRRSECVLKLDRNEQEIVAFAPEIVSEEPLKHVRRTA